MQTQVDAKMAPWQVRTSATLLATSLVARLPQAMAAIALVRIVLDAGGTYGFAGALTSTYVLTSTLSAPLLSRIIDRTGRPRPVLVGAATVSSLAFVCIALTVRDHALVGAAAALVAGIATPPVEPALRSLWPRIMSPGRQLVRAFGVDAAVQEIIFILGPLATAVAAALLGARGAVVTMAAFGLAGTALFCLHGVLGAPASAARDGHGHASPLRTAALRVLVLAQVMAGVPVGVLTITAAAHADRLGDSALAGWGLAVNACGALVGAVVIARWPVRIAAERALRLALLGLAALYLPTAWIQADRIGWLATALVSGLFLPPFLTQVFAVTEHVCPPGLLTEANGWIISAFGVGIAAGMFGAGLATDQWSAAGTVGGVLGSCVIAALGAVIARPHALAPDRGAPDPAATPSRLG